MAEVRGLFVGVRVWREERYGYDYGLGSGVWGIGAWNGHAREGIPGEGLGEGVWSLG